MISLRKSRKNNVENKINTPFKKSSKWRKTLQSYVALPEFSKKNGGGLKNILSPIYYLPYIQNLKPLPTVHAELQNEIKYICALRARMPLGFGS